MTVVTVDPASINKDICDQTDFLIAEHKYLEPLLFLQNHGRLKFVQNTWAGVDSLIKVVKGRVKDYCNELQKANVLSFSSSQKRNSNQT